MALTLAQLDYGTFIGLGSPDTAVCDHIDIHYAVRDAVCLLTRQMRTTDQNRTLSKTGEFTPTASPHNITSLLSNQHFANVAWVDRKNGDRWEPVQVVNRAELEEMYSRGINAAAIYADETPAMYIEFSYPVTSTSNTTYRIWYDQDVVSFALNGTVLLPDSFAPYIERLAQNALIPRMESRMADSIESEEMLKLLQPKLNALRSIYLENEKQMIEWRNEFNIWKNRAVGTQYAGNLPSKTGRHFYGR